MTILRPVKPLPLYPLSAFLLHYLIIAFFLISLPLPVIAASCNEICRNSSECDMITAGTYFWTPSSSDSAFLTAPVLIPGGSTNRTYVASAPRRSITLTGINIKHELFVGSIDSPQTFNGVGGNNTYVVGGASAALISGSNSSQGDKNFLMALTAGEGDFVNASGGQVDFVYVNKLLQRGTGPIKMANDPTGPARSFRGSGELASPCQASLSGDSTRRSIPMLASLMSSWPSLSDTYINVRQWVKDFWSLFKPNPFAKPTPFPGVASVAGLDVGLTSVDRIFLPADEFTFNGKPLNAIESLTILGIKNFRSEPSKIVKPQELEQLLSESKGLPGVPTNIAPLIYFEDEGLLVSSLNSEPLGTSANPGKPIVRLLDRRGRPQALTPERREGIDLAPNQTLYQAPFLVFEPTNLPNFKTADYSQYSNFNAPTVPSTAWMITSWLGLSHSKIEWQVSLLVMFIFLSMCSIASLRWLLIPQMHLLKAITPSTNLKVVVNDDKLTVKSSSTI